ncbi:MAG TPA: hypothetical protein VGB73_07655 [Pyrinomonadaceae bacterium]|jgi:hypothetical protein
MSSSRRSKLITFALLAVALAAMLFIVQSNCPTSGITFSAEKAAFVRLKNRTALPQEADFDRRVTLETLLQPLDDRGRWSESRAVVVEGYVVGVGAGGIEAANCFSPVRRDTHIYLSSRRDAQTRERIVAEVTPRIRDWARHHGRDWSEAALRRELAGRWCRVEGWLLFDREHEEEAENTSPGRPGNWRATAWEIHPVTSIEVLR